MPLVPFRAIYYMLIFSWIYWHYMFNVIPCVNANGINNMDSSGSKKPKPSAGKKINTCSGTDNSLNQIRSYSQKRIASLRQHYENCTIIAGNLEITHLTEHDLKNEGDLDFLSSIEEVIGYVAIAFNRIQGISLPNLRIIWGDKLFHPLTDHAKKKVVSGYFGLLIMDNTFEYLDMRSLTAVQHGDIGLYFNPSLCHWNTTTLDYRQFLGDEYESRLKLLNNFENCTEKTYNCSKDCSFCYGPLTEQCQKIYRTDCAPQCTNGMCFNTTYPQYCCHPECTGGCFGPSDSQCYGCKSMRDEGRCVERCSAPELYVPSKAQYEPNPNGKYAYNRMCVKQCPVHMATYKEGCVARCPGNFYSNENMSCVPCVGSCPKICEINQSITAANIQQFVNCTKIQGFIEIIVDSFKEVKGFGKLTAEDMNILSNIEQVSDYVMVQSKEYLTNLEFLRNLRKIEGRRLFQNKFALVITHTDLRYLGLVSLQKVAHGEIHIAKNHELCYIQDFPWKDISEGTANIKFNRDSGFCVEEDKYCNNSCEPKKGCWGPGPNMCYECKQWKMDNLCVDHCNTSSGFFEPSPKLCERCHPECVTCNQSSSARDCLECKNVRQDGECVAHCDNLTRYLNESTNTCELCHANCFTFGCTGPGNFVGRGGCNKCKFGVVENDAVRVSRCLHSISQETCSKETGLENYYWNSPTMVRDGSIEHGVCAKCHPACRTCTHYGREVENHGCMCSSFRVHRRSVNIIECDIQCPINYFGKNESTIESSPQVTDCYPCHLLCDGCYGPYSTNCSKCKSYQIINDDDNTVNCTESCPTDKPYPDTDKICRKEDMEAIANFKRKRYQTIIIACCLTIFALLIAVSIVACVMRRRAKLLAKLNLPDEHFEMNLNAKPNLSQLRVIIENELKMGDVLGYGAFGTVYKGIWASGNTNQEKVPVAIKVLHDARPSAQQEMVEEAGHMARVTHPYLLSLIGICFGKRMMLVTPLMLLGNLLDYVKNHRSKIGSSALLRWATQTASGMAYLEDCRLVHRDLAARNLLVQNPHHVRITDFGLAKMLEYGEDELKVVEGKMPIKWLALESIQYRRFTHKSDVWAFGVTVWELLTFGEKPYKDVPLLQIPDLLEKGERLPQPKSSTLDVYMVLLKCWMVDADSRPSFKELYETFSRMLKDPGRYLVIEGDKLLRLPSYSVQDQRDMLRHLIDDPDVCNPDDYLEGGGSSTLPSLPSSPTTPSKPLMENHIQRRYGQRLQSTNSHRYASDPLSKPLLATDADNYLIPDRQKLTPTSVDSGNCSAMYTPVITASNSCAEAFQFPDVHSYYNDLHVQPQPPPPPPPFDGTIVPDKITVVDNFEYLLGSDVIPTAPSTSARRNNDIPASAKRWNDSTPISSSLTRWNDGPTSSTRQNDIPTPTTMRSNDISAALVRPIVSSETVNNNVNDLDRSSRRFDSDKETESAKNQILFDYDTETVV